MRVYDGFKMKTAPWTHQIKALSYLYGRDAAALYTKPGSGKTKIMIDLIINRNFKRVLVVAPKKPCAVWPVQFQLHSGLGYDNVIPLFDLGWEQKETELKLAAAQPKDKLLVFVVNYESVWRKPLDRMLFYKNIGLDCVICDESHRIKSPGSKCSKFLARLGKAVPHRYLMTGTPLAENPMDVYAQYRFLDPSIFGTNYYAFCDQYQNVDPYLSAKIGHTVLDAKNPYKNLSVLREKMFSCAFYMESTIPLPRAIHKIVPVPMDESTESMYRELLKEGALEIDDGFMTVNNVLAMTTRKQQVTSGYIPLEYDDGTKALKRISTYRRTFLYKFIQDIPKDEPIVVFAKFRKDLYAIRKVAERLDCGYSEVSGSEDSLPDWKQGKTRIIGVQYGSGSEGIDLTRAHICIFYGLDHSLAKYEQACKRIHRPGQNSPCIYYHFVAKMSSGRTVDEEIVQCWKNKESYIQAVIQGKFST